MISVIMSCFNEENKVTRAVNSILNQTYTDFEFIICDDCSKDNTYQVLCELAKKDSRIIVLKNEENLRLSKSLNKCIKIAKGEYIARMDADDISEINRFEEQVKFLDSNPEYAFCGTTISLFDETGIWGNRVLQEVPINKSFLSTSPFVHPTIIFRRECLFDVGLYTEKNIGRAEDYELFAKLYSKGYKGYNIQENLFNYYESKQSYKKRTWKAAFQEIPVRNRIYKMLKLYPRAFIYLFKPVIVKLMPYKIRLFFHKKAIKSK